MLAQWNSSESGRGLVSKRGPVAKCAPDPNGLFPRTLALLQVQPPNVSVREGILPGTGGADIANFSAALPLLWLSSFSAHFLHTGEALHLKTHDRTACVG